MRTEHGDPGQPYAATVLNRASRQSLPVVLLLTACTTVSPGGDDTARHEPFVVATEEVVAAPSPMSSTTATPVPPTGPVIEGIDVALALSTAQALVDLGERLPGTASGAATTDAVSRLLFEAGWDVELETFELPQGGTSANVVASWGGRGRGGEPHVVVGGHWDTVPGTVGANDNASGIGVLVALAEELRDEAADLSVPVVLVAFGAEEYQSDTGVHHVGSEHHAATTPGVQAMLAVDMVGNGVETLVVGLDGAPDDLVRDLVEVAVTAGIPDVRGTSRGDISDHGPFARRDIPAAFLWTDRDGRLHTPADTFEHLDPDDLVRSGDLVLAWLRGHSRVGDGT